MLRILFSFMLLSQLSAYASNSVEDRLAKLEKITALQHNLLKPKGSFYESKVVSKNFSGALVVNKIKVSKADKYLVIFDSTVQKSGDESVRAVSSEIKINNTLQASSQTTISNYDYQGATANYDNNSVHAVVDLGINDEIDFSVKSTEVGAQLYSYSISILPIPVDGSNTIGTVIETIPPPPAN